jgi:hypothetical protein
MGSTGGQVVHKHFRLDSGKLKRAQKLLKTKTETETVERALDLVISEQERDRIVSRAHDEFFRSGIEIRDAFGALGVSELGR